MEHFARTFTVGAGYYRGVEIEKPFIIEKLVDCKCHCVTDSQYGAESVGTRAQVSYLTQKFHTVPLLLKRVDVGVGST